MKDPNIQLVYEERDKKLLLVVDNRGVYNEDEVKVARRVAQCCRCGTCHCCRIDAYYRTES